MNVINALSKQRRAPSQLSICIEILQVYNCRAGEVLNASWNKYYPSKMLILHGEKRSANIIIRDRKILEEIEKLPKLHKTKIFPSVNYGMLYRYCKKYYSHLFIQFKGKKNYKVTHGFRYRAITEVDIDEEIREILHHRSIKSGKYYKLK